MMKPVIALSGIKTVAFASEETHCYEATLIVDGEKWGTVSNDGHGGPDQFHGIGGRNLGDIAALDKRIAATYPADESYGMTISASLEILCCDLVNAHLQRADFKRVLRKPCYINDKGELMQFKLPKGVRLDEALPQIRAKRPDLALLNDMPEADAFAALKAVI